VTMNVDLPTLLAVLTDVILTAYFAGRIAQSLADHDRRISVLEKIHPRQPERRAEP
jgi:hypothetical protein